MKLDIGSRKRRVLLLVLVSIALVACGGGGDSTSPPPNGFPPTIGGVSGTASHGNSITIAGSSFGTKSHAGPMLWDDFELGSHGSPVASSAGGATPRIHQGNLVGYTQWEQGSGLAGLSIQFDNSAPKANSFLHARATFANDSYSFLDLTVPYTQFTTGNELYFSFYYRLTKTGADFPRQTKVWIAYPSIGSDKAYFSTAFEKCESGGFRLHRTEGGFFDEAFPLAGIDVSGEWIRFETYLKQSAPGIANGTWLQAAYRPTLGTPARLIVSLTNAQLRTSSDDWVDWTFGGAYWSMCGLSDTGTIDIDEFYMDSTPARVEVCNAPTLSASTKCELQIPAVWSDTSITVAFKQGYLSSGPAYVYVVNAAGRVNTVGHAITIMP